jgi:hypothetical protein
MDINEKMPYFIRTNNVAGKKYTDRNLMSTNQTLLFE